MVVNNNTPFFYKLLDQQHLANLVTIISDFMLSIIDCLVAVDLTSFPGNSDDRSSYNITN